MCAACRTPHRDQSYELCPPWEQHLRYVPHRVRNGYNTAFTGEYSHRKTEVIIHALSVIQPMILLIVWYGEYMP